MKIWDEFLFYTALFNSGFVGAIVMFFWQEQMQILEFYFAIRKSIIRVNFFVKMVL